VTATTAVQADHRGLLLQAYAAYNSQGVEGLGHWSAMTSMARRRRWQAARQRRGTGLLDGAVGPHEHPRRAVSFSERNDGRTAVHISQVVRSLDGSVISKGKFLHLHRLEGDRIARMDIEAHLEL
jgi:hypothetical protein